MTDGLHGRSLRSRAPFRRLPLRRTETNKKRAHKNAGLQGLGVFDDEVAGGPVSLIEVHGEPVGGKTSQLEHDSYWDRSVRVRGAKKEDPQNE